MSEPGSIDERAMFNLAMRILGGLAAIASRRADHDPEWVARRDEFARLRNRLDPHNVDEVRAVVEEYGPQFEALTNPR